MKAVIRVFQNMESLSHAAAHLFIEQAGRAIAGRGRFLAALCGGDTPLRLYQLLGTDYARQIAWGNIHLFWGDERCVPPDDAGSSYGQARGVFLSHVPIPDENIHRIKGELGPAAASKDYAQTLKDFAAPGLDWPRSDLVLLGMGEDGHTASLFPGSEVEVSSPTMPVTAHYQDRPADRVTLTPRVFNSAREVAFLVTGANKAETLARVLSDKYEPEQLPAQRIRPEDGTLTWLVDEAAASQLEKDFLETDNTERK